MRHLAPEPEPDGLGRRLTLSTGRKVVVSTRVEWGQGRGGFSECDPAMGARGLDAIRNASLYRYTR